MAALMHASIALDGVAGKWPNMLRKDATSVLDLDLTRFEKSLDDAIDGGLATKWHMAVGYKPKWVPSKGYDLADARDRIHNNSMYIDKVLSELGHKIDYAEVVNEVLQPDGSGFRRFPNVISYDPITVDEIVGYFRAFEEHEGGDRQFKLGINEYGVEKPGLKQDTYFHLCVDARDQGARIDWVGMQCHLDAADAPSRRRMYEAFSRFKEEGFAVHITELDIRVGNVDGTRLQKQERQEEVARDVMVAARDAEVDAVITWGTSDANSWIYSKHDTAFPEEQPLPFNHLNGVKPFWEQILRHTRAGI